MLQSETARIRAISLVTIRRSPREIYEYWREFANLPRFMQHVQSVRVLDTHRSRWIAYPAPGVRAEWDTEIVYDRPNERIAWHCVGTEIESAGAVNLRAAPRDMGTDVLLEISYSSLCNSFGAAAPILFGRDPSRQAHEDLQHLKCLLESESALEMVMPSPHLIST